MDYISHLPLWSDIAINQRPVHEAENRNAVCHLMVWSPDTSYSALPGFSALRNGDNLNVAPELAISKTQPWDDL